MTGPFPWPRGAATGLGSLPGDDPAEAVRLIMGELPDLPHLPELPARGPGSDLIGRSATFLVDLPVDLQPSGWRLVDRVGHDLRRARDLLARDLDALAEGAAGYTGPLKVQVAGPWTLAAGLELHRGDKAVADPGAVRDLIQSLAEGVREHLAEVSRRVPGASLVLQLDEPSLPTVLAGGVPTPSGLGRLAVVEASTAREGLAAVLSAGGAGASGTAGGAGASGTAGGAGASGTAGGAAFPAVHCCAAGAPVALLRAAGARAVAVDAALLRPADDDAVGAAVEAGVAFWLGLVPGTDPGPVPAAGSAIVIGAGQASRNGNAAGSGAGRGGARSVGAGPGPAGGDGGATGLGDLRATVTAAQRLWQRLGFGAEQLADLVVVTPTCGLAGASAPYARAALRRCREAGRALAEG